MLRAGPTGSNSGSDVAAAAACSTNGGLQARAEDELERDGQRICVRDVLVPGSVLPHPSDGTCMSDRVIFAQSWRREILKLRQFCRRGSVVDVKTIAGIGSRLLRVCRGNVGVLASVIGDKVFSPHVHVECVEAWFGGVKHFPEIAALLTALSPGVPVDVKPGGDLHAELSYGNHRSAGSHCDAIYEELVYDVIHGRALVFDRCFAREIA